jgi:SAM-dependent methyltransferase
MARQPSLGRITDAVEEALLLKVVGSPSGLRVLDVGCGDARPAVALAERGAAVTGIDADPRVRRVRGAVYYPPFGGAAALLARWDRWIGARTTAGAAFLVVAGRKPA